MLKEISLVIAKHCTAFRSVCGQNFSNTYHSHPKIKNKINLLN